MKNQLVYQLRYMLPIWFSFLITSWLPDNRVSIAIRGRLVSLFLPGKPKGLTLGRDVTLLNVDNLFFGKDVYLAKSVWLNALGGIHIEDEVVVSPYAVIASTKHSFKDASVKKGGTFTAPISIGRGSWVSSHATIAAGSTIGQSCLIAANTLVSGHVPDRKMAVGVPFKIVKDVQDREGGIYRAR